MGVSRSSPVQPHGLLAPSRLSQRPPRCCGPRRGEWQGGGVSVACPGVMPSRSRCRPRSRGSLRCDTFDEECRRVWVPHTGGRQRLKRSVLFSLSHAALLELPEGSSASISPSWSSGPRAGKPPGSCSLQTGACPPVRCPLPWPVPSCPFPCAFCPARRWPLDPGLLRLGQRLRGCGLRGCGGAASAEGGLHSPRHLVPGPLTLLLVLPLSRH